MSAPNDIVQQLLSDGRPQKSAMSLQSPSTANSRHDGKLPGYYSRSFTPKTRKKHSNTGNGTPKHSKSRTPRLREKRKATTPLRRSYSYEESTQPLEKRPSPVQDCESPLKNRTNSSYATQNSSRTESPLQQSRPSSRSLERISNSSRRQPSTMYSRKSSRSSSSTPQKRPSPLSASSHNQSRKYEQSQSPGKDYYSRLRGNNTNNVVEDFDEQHQMEQERIKSLHATNAKAIQHLERNTEQRLDNVHVALSELTQVLTKMERRISQQDEAQHDEDVLVDRVIQKMEEQIEPILSQQVHGIKESIMVAIANKFASLETKVKEIEKTIFTQESVDQYIRSEVSRVVKRSLQPVEESIDDVNRRLQEVPRLKDAQRDFEESMSELVVKRMEDSEKRIRNSMQTIVGTKSFRNRITKDLMEEKVIHSPGRRAKAEHQISQLENKIQQLESTLHENHERDCTSQDWVESQVLKLSSQISNIRTSLDQSVAELNGNVHKMVPSLIQAHLQSDSMSRSMEANKSGTSSFNGTSTNVNKSTDRNVSTLSEADVNKIVQQHLNQMSASRQMEVDNVQQLVQDEVHRVMNNSRSGALSVTQPKGCALHASPIPHKKSVYVSTPDIDPQNYSNRKNRPHTSAHEPTLFDEEPRELINHSELQQESRNSEECSPVHRVESKDKSKNSSVASPDNEPKELDEDFHHLDTGSYSSSAQLSGVDSIVEYASRENESEQVDLSNTFDDSQQLSLLQSSLISNAGGSKWAFCLHIPLIIFFAVIGLIIYDYMFPLRMQFASEGFFPS